ncbi:MAG: RNA polymerase sigma factor [Fimbriimonas sp.]
MIVVEDLVAFVSSSPEGAAVAFERISPQVRRYLKSHLGRFGIDDDAVEDVAQEVLEKLWTAREAIEIRGVGPWWCFVKRTADWIAIDWIRKRGRETSVAPETLGDIPDEDIPCIADMAEMARLREELLRVADECWLQAMPHNGKEALAVAVLVFADDVPFDEACDLLGIAPGDPQRAVANAIAEPAIFLRAAFAALYWSNARLVRHLLGEASESDPQWTEVEARAIALRYGNGMTSDRIARFRWCPLDAKALEAFFEGLADRLPFLPAAERLRQGGRRIRKGALLAGPGLWRRLAFQYWYIETLPHRQILERTEASAKHLGTGLTAAMLNVWIGNHRLAAELGRCVQGRAK